MHRREVLIGALALGIAAQPAGAATEAARFVFEGIDRAPLDLRAFRGGPVLVVNTASRCAFTGQYDGLQALYDRFRDRGLTVVGVPSDSFRQELDTAAEVKEFCEVNFAIDFPMTSLVAVTGASAHPFYGWARDQGIVPGWNFHKILLGPDGEIAGDFATSVEPDASEIARAIAALLPPGLTHSTPRRRERPRLRSAPSEPQRASYAGSVPSRNAPAPSPAPTCGAK